MGDFFDLTIQELANKVQIKIKREAKETEETRTVKTDTITIKTTHTIITITAKIRTSNIKKFNKSNSQIEVAGEQFTNSEVNTIVSTVEEWDICPEDIEQPDQIRTIGKKSEYQP